MDLAEAVGKYYKVGEHSSTSKYAPKTVDKGYAELGRRLGKSNKWVREHLTLANAPDKLKELVRQYDNWKMKYKKALSAALVSAGHETFWRQWEC